MKKFLGFWLFLLFYKFAGDTFANLMSPLGSRVFPVEIVGLLIGLEAFIQLILDVPAGFLLDKYGYRRLLKLTVLLFVLATSFLLLGLNKFSFVVALISSSLGWLFFNPGANAYVLSVASKQNAGKLISFRNIFDSVGVVFAAVGLNFALKLPLLSVVLIILFLFAITYFFISIAPKDKEVVDSKNKKISSHHFFIRRTYLIKVMKSIKKLDPASWILILTNLSSSTFYAIVWFVVPLMIANNLGGEIMGVSLGIFDLAIVVTGFFLGKLADKLNKRLLVFVGLLIFSVAGILLGFSLGWFFLILSFIATTGDEMTSLSLWSWLNSLNEDDEDDGLIAGILGMFQDFGWTIGPIISGFLYPIIGPQLTITFGGVMVFVVFLIYWIKFDKSKDRFQLVVNKYDIRPHRHRSKR